MLKEMKTLDIDACCKDTEAKTEAKVQEQLNFQTEKAKQLEILLEDKETEFHETLINEKENI